MPFFQSGSINNIPTCHPDDSERLIQADHEVVLLWCESPLLVLIWIPEHLFYLPACHQNQLWLLLWLSVVLSLINTL